MKARPFILAGLGFILARGAPGMTGSARVWEEDLELPTYEMGAPAEPAPGRWARYADPDGADLVHVHDAARAAVLALEAPVAGRVYNIASGRDGCIERARLQLGWKPGISLAQGIAEAAPAAVRTCAPAGA